MTERTFACRRCGRTFNKRRSLTRTGYCSVDCGTDAMIRNVVELQERVGPGYDRWREGMLRSLGVTSGGGGPATEPDD